MHLAFIPAISRIFWPHAALWLRPSRPGRNGQSVHLLRLRHLSYLASLLPLLVLLSFLAPVAGATTGPLPAADLAEREYIAQRAAVRVGVVVGNEPYALLRNGQATGFSIDVLREIEARSGLRFDLRLGSWSEIYQAFRSGQIDVVDAISHLPEREAFTRFTPPYHWRETALFENSERPLSNPSNFRSLPAKTRIGVVRDIYYLPALRQHSAVELVEYPNYVDLVKSLAFGWLDGAVIGRLTGDYLIREHNFTHLRAVGPLGIDGVDTEDFRLGIQKNDPMLHQVLTRVMVDIPASTYSKLEDRWSRYRGHTPVTAPLQLNDAERAFVVQHPVMRVGTLVDYEPFSFVARGQPQGFSVSLAEQLVERIGMRVEPVVDTWSRLLERFRRGELDAIANMSWTKDRATYTLFTQPYHQIPNVVFVRDDFGPWQGLPSLQHKRLGMTREVFYRQQLQKQVSSADLVEFESQEEMMRALAFGHIDAVATALHTGNKHIRKLGLSNLTIAGPLALPELVQEDLRFGISPAAPILRGLFDKALASMPVEALAELETRWLSARPARPPLATDAAAAAPRLSDNERRLLAERGGLRLCMASDWPPYASLDGEGRLRGLLADLLEAITAPAGIALRLVPTQHWADAAARFAAGDCDLLAPAMETPEKRQTQQFTTPLVTAAAVIVTRIDSPFIDHPQQLAGQAIGLVRDHPATELLRQRYPQLQLVAVDSDEQGLVRTQRGELFGHISSMAGMAYLLTRLRAVDLKIGGRLLGDWPYRLAIPAAQPEMYALLQRLIDDLDPDEQQRLVDRWLALRPEPDVDLQRVWQGGSLLLLMLWGLWYANTRLKRLNADLRAANARLHDISLHDELTGLYNRNYLKIRSNELLALCQRHHLPLALVMIDIDHFKQINDRYGHVSGDHCLQQMAAILRQAFQRQSDFVLRYGGEEFMACMTGETLEGLQQHLEALRAQIAATAFTVTTQTTPLQLSVSMGCCQLIPGGNDHYTAMVEAADAALYEAKAGGRNQVRITCKLDPSSTLRRKRDETTA